MATSEYRKRRSTAKSSLTKVITQESIEPSHRDRYTLDHLSELLQRAEDVYTINYESLESPSTEEENYYHDFTKLADDARLRISSMMEQCECYRMFNTLSHEVEDWEVDTVELQDAFLAELPRLQKTLDGFRISSCSTGASKIASLKAHAKDLRHRLTRLKQRATFETSTTTSIAVHNDSEDTYRHEKKARMVPLPTFKGDLADWRSFWRRFQHYVGKLKRITDDEKLSYL